MDHLRIFCSFFKLSNSLKESDTLKFTLAFCLAFDILSSFNFVWVGLSLFSLLHSCQSGWFVFIRSHRPVSAFLPAPAASETAETLLFYHNRAVHHHRYFFSFLIVQVAPNSLQTGLLQMEPPLHLHCSPSFLSSFISLWRMYCPYLDYSFIYPYFLSHPSLISLSLISN